MEAGIFEKSLGAQFYTGVPDSLLKPFCDHLVDKYGFSNNHIVAANEGNAVGLAAGYYMATGKVPVVYLQNSGIGNIMNPVASLLNEKVYGIPCMFVVGWRGEPGKSDEPQHVFQGEVTLQLLKDMNMDIMVVDSDTTPEEIEHKISVFSKEFLKGRSLSFVVRKGAFTCSQKRKYHNDHVMIREHVIQNIVEASEKDIVVATTGKISRELFEIRETKSQSHSCDFLTVGSMGHCSSIALSVALQKPGRKVWCIDGDGAMLMHMGAMTVIGTKHPANLVHIVINNGAHETVGGIPTAADHPGVSLTEIAKACGYACTFCAEGQEELDEALAVAKAANDLCFVEIKSAIGSRSDLGRPTISTHENISSFMEALR